MGELLQTLYLRSRDQYEGALRWSAILLGFTLLLHLMVLTELARCKRDISVGTTELTRLQAAVIQSQNLQTNLARFQVNTLSAVTNVMHEFALSLRADFTNLYLASVHARSVGVYPEERPSTLQNEPASGSELARQMPPMPKSAAERVPWGTWVSKKDYQALIQAARSPDQAEAVLLPVVKRLILTPRFTEVNQSWNQTVARTKKVAEELVQEAQALEKSVSSTNEVQSLQGVQQSVRSVVTGCEGYHFQLPTDDTWWRSVTGKEGFRDAQVLALSTQVSSVEKALSFADSLRAELERAYKRREELNQSVLARQSLLEKSLQQSQERLGQLAKPLQLIALDADVLLARLPLLVGLVIGLALFWTAHHARALRSAAAALPDKGLIESNPAVFAPGSLPSSGRRVVAFLSVLWLAGAYWTASISAGASTGILLSALTGLAVICSALWYRRRIS